MSKHVQENRVEAVVVLVLEVSLYFYFISLRIY